MSTSSPSTNIVAEANVPIAAPSGPASDALRSNVMVVVVGSSPTIESGAFPRGTWTRSRYAPGRMRIVQRAALFWGAASIAACTDAYFAPVVATTASDEPDCAADAGDDVCSAPCARLR